jgi:hypothetical protein
VTHDGVMKPRDELQARVIERLRAAHGAPVSFAELRGMGIENPALLGYELAAAGLPIEQARETGGGALTLDPPPKQPEGDERPAADSSGPLASAPVRGLRSLPRVHLRLPSGLHPSRAGVVATVALIAVLAVVLVLALSGHHARTTRLTADHQRQGSSRSPGTNARRLAPRVTSTPTREVTRTAPPVPAQRAPSVAVSPAAAASLEAEGHEMLAQGRYAQAIGALRGAIEASGGSVARCAEPTSEACLTYAYALYDLGSALRLDGDPSAAIPVLSERLLINNQRVAVQAQLELARAARS